jgi:hypothetical protein
MVQMHFPWRGDSGTEIFFIEISQDAVCEEQIYYRCFLRCDAESMPVCRRQPADVAWREFLIDTVYPVPQLACFHPEHFGVVMPMAGVKVKPVYCCPVQMKNGRIFLIVKI